MLTMTNSTIKDFLNGKVKFDEFTGGYFWIVAKDGEHRMLADTRIRGWGEIHNLFKHDYKAAAAFQDELGKFIADAINEKIERDFKTDKP